MQPTLTDVKFLYPETPCFDSLKKESPWEIFSAAALDFLDDLSKKLFADVRLKQLPDVASFAFWCRRANMLKLKQEYCDSKIRMGRGIAFHIAPANVPINFAFSFAAGLLAGNVNIVRVPSKDFLQTSLICEKIAGVLTQKKHLQIAQRIFFIKYERSSRATEFFSALCDVRIIWGGDESIREIRKCAIPARSIDITFADRYSICVINADEYIHEKNPLLIANSFYNDTYLYDQNACSAPHLVVWQGEEANIMRSKQIFWTALHSVVKDKYELQAVVAVDKLTAAYRQAIENDTIRIVAAEDNFINRIELGVLEQDIENCRSYGGYFCEYNVANIDEISHVINRKYQTLAYYGLKQEVLARFRLENEFAGLDRIVPIGRTADFSLTWDGYSLPHTLSTICDII